MEDAQNIAKQYAIETRVVDLTAVKAAEIESLESSVNLNKAALANMAPRLRMITLYAIAASENRLVAGTGNRSEAYVGYFTKWGDGAHDFNPISDLTVTEIYEFLHYLNAPQWIMQKAPSAALFDGQTDETEMGITYAEIDSYINGGNIGPEKSEIIRKLHETSTHKRCPIITFDSL